MRPLRHCGAVPHDLGPLLSILAGLPQSAWTMRVDHESDRTCTIRENNEAFPQVAVASLLDAATASFLASGYQNRIVLSMVPAGEEILPHSDDFGGQVQASSLHCHIPLITDDACVMGFPDHGIIEHMHVGHLYTMDATQRHYVKNPSEVNRVHLLFAHFPHGGL